MFINNYIFIASAGEYNVKFKEPDSHILHKLKIKEENEVNRRFLKSEQLDIERILSWTWEIKELKRCPLFWTLLSKKKPEPTSCLMDLAP